MWGVSEKCAPLSQCLKMPVFAAQMLCIFLGVNRYLKDDFSGLPLLRQGAAVAPSPPLSGAILLPPKMHAGRHAGQQHPVSLEHKYIRLLRLRLLILPNVRYNCEIHSRWTDVHGPPHAMTQGSEG